MGKKLLTFYFSGAPYTICDYMLRLAREFAKDDLVFGFLLYSDPYSVWKDVWDNTKKPWIKREGIYMIRQINLLPFQRFGLIKWLNRRLHVILAYPLLVWWIKCFKEHVWNTGKPVFIFYHPEKEVGFFRFVYWFFSLAHTTLFDVVDYPPVHRETSALNIYKEYIRKADIVTVNSRSLYSLFSRIRSGINIVPLGFALDEFEHPKKTIQLPKDKPIVGFVGALGSRLDYRLLFALVSGNPQWRFVFWGPTQIVEGENGMQIRKNVKKLLSFPNVIHGVSTDKREVAGIIRQFSVGIIPYDTNQDQNKYCFPMKVFEYYYMKKLILSTPIMELKWFPKHIKVGSIENEWERHIKVLLQCPGGDELSQERFRLATANSWEKKAYVLKRMLQK